MMKKKIAIGACFGLIALLLIPRAKPAHAFLTDCYDDWGDWYLCDDGDGSGGDGTGTYGCDGFGGSYDQCGVCNGSGTTCGGCDGLGGTVDACGVCNGSGNTCGGCDGQGGSVDACGVCAGDGSSCAADSQCKPSSWTWTFITAKCSGGCEECAVSASYPSENPKERDDVELYSCESMISTYRVCPVYRGNCCPAVPLPCGIQTSWDGERVCGQMPAAFCGK